MKNLPMFYAVVIGNTRSMFPPLSLPNLLKQATRSPLPSMLVQILPTQTQPSIIFAGLRSASNRITITSPMSWQIFSLLLMASA